LYRYVKQEKVPCLTDNDAHLALDGKDPYKLQTKPHGHGDVHAVGVYKLNPVGP
jgi:UDP-sugar pyrophosphorylase